MTFATVFKGQMESMRNIFKVVEMKNMKIIHQNNPHLMNLTKNWENMNVKSHVYVNIDAKVTVKAIFVPVSVSCLVNVSIEINVFLPKNQC